MNKIFHVFSKNNRFIQLTAAVVIVCMGLADASLYLNYTALKGNSTDTDKDYDYVVREDHTMETALADGDYTGDNSDMDSTDDGFGEIRGGRKMFNVLEILPTEKKASFGYTIGGCEPFSYPDGSKIVDVKVNGEVVASAAKIREAFLDACINPTPGQKYNNDDPNSINMLDHNALSKRFNQDLKGAFGDGGIAPFTFEDNKAYKGHYKKICNNGENKGVFRYVSGSDSNVVMRSRFYDSGSHNDYNYIFVYDVTSSDPGDINVTNHKRIRYINNEKFLKEGYGLSGDDVQKFKDEHIIDVVTRTPRSVSLDDIEDADLIILNNADSSTMRYYNDALRIYNTIHGMGTEDDINATFYDQNNPSNSVDFDNFEKVIRIYERVAVREDVAFVGSRSCVSGTTFNTNVRKLMFMLFYIHMKIDEYEQTDWWGNKTKIEVLDSYCGSGRDLFMNFMKRYGEEPGVYYGRDYWALRQNYEAAKNNPDEHIRDKNPDYRAPSLRHDKYYEGIPYMHYSPLRDPGHPLVKTPQEAIIGGYYENGHLVPRKAADASQATERIMRRKDTSMYQNYGLDWWEGENVKGYKYYAKTYISMSNTTDYVYIDENTGNLVIPDKYIGYWYNIDDDSAGGHDYKRMSWEAKTWTTWPSGDDLLKDWFIHKDRTNQVDGYYDKGDLHLWFDYQVYGNYRSINTPPPGGKFLNQAIEGENGLFKDGLINSALTQRKYVRETYDEDHIRETVRKQYFIAMNVLNGDGVNRSPGAGANKTLYFNGYEKDKITAQKGNADETYIPIKIRIKSTCKLNTIRVLGESGTELAKYNINSDVSNNLISCTGTGGSVNIGGHTVNINARTLKLDPKNNIDPNTHQPTLLTDPDHVPIYQYEGYIQAELSDLYLISKNTKFIIEMSSEKPGGNESDPSDDAVATDTITVVRRDFFKLN